MIVGSPPPRHAGKIVEEFALAQKVPRGDGCLRGLRRSITAKGCDQKTPLRVRSSPRGGDPSIRENERARATFVVQTRERRVIARRHSWSVA